MKPKIIYHESRSLFLLIIITIFLLFFSTLSSSVFANKSIRYSFMNLVEQHGEIVFQAIANLPETRRWISEVIEEQEGYCSIYYTSSLKENQKQKMINAIVQNLFTDNSYKLILKMINSWCIAKRQFEILLTYEDMSEEILFAALYNVPLTNPLFRSILTNRKIAIEDKISSIDIGATLSSAERGVIFCNALNMLSKLPEVEIMSCFRHILTILPNLLTE